MDPSAAGPATETPTTSPAASIVIVTYQSASYIGACLSSIDQHAGVPVETIVVDNGSTDGTLRIATENSPSLPVIGLPTNRGFAAAANAGAARGSAAYILFLNPDAQLQEGALPALVGHLRGHSQTAAAGPRLVFPDGRPQDSAFTYPSLMMTWFEFFPRPARLMHTRLNGRLHSSDGQPVAVDHPLGACMLVRRAAWEDVGPFDERFFLYCEEVDWCMRAKRRGWTIAHVPAAVVTHAGGQSAAAAPGPSLIHLYESRTLLHRKHRGLLFRAVATAITRAGLARERRRLLRSDLPQAEMAPMVAAIETAIHRTRP